MKRKIVTIDGPAGSGKSSVSRLLSDRLGFIYMDTGAMYRAVALYACREGVDLQDGKKLYKVCMDMDLEFMPDNGSPKIFLGKEDVTLEIRRPEMDMLSSNVSTVKEVRDAMTVMQRRIASKGGVVAEGRDMGTVVFPWAEDKFYLTATVEVRAFRRFLERKDRGECPSLEEVETDLRKRDGQDEKREIAPLRPAEDAIIIDTSHLSLQQVVDKIMSIIIRP